MATDTSEKRIDSADGLADADRPAARVNSRSSSA